MRSWVSHPCFKMKGVFVWGERLASRGTNLRFTGLFGEAFATDDFTNGEPIDQMMLLIILKFIIIQIQWHRMPALYLPAPSIVGTCRRRCCCCCCCRRGHHGGVDRDRLSAFGGGQNGTIIVTDTTTQGQTATGGNNGALTLVVIAGGTTVFHEAAHLIGMVREERRGHRSDGGPTIVLAPVL